VPKFQFYFGWGLGGVVGGVEGVASENLTQKFQFYFGWGLSRVVGVVFGE
jgi:hypothetical protein